MEKVYLCIDLKSFYASVEAVERGLDPFSANLVVADASRGRGAICLAITPALKEKGIRNRCRLFEIPASVEYIAAMPRMKKYMEYSAEIYGVYLRFVAKEDILVYSIDECFFDITAYLMLYGKTPREIAKMIMDAVFCETGISASCGIGTNLFLSKVALDITAKHSPDRIGILDEETYKKTLWHHTPLTDFWNVGPGITRRLMKYGIEDMYGIAHADEAVLYREFGKNAAYLIDHAKGIEPCTISEIHAFTPKSTSVSSGQILFENYGYDDARLALREMVETLSLELIERGMKTDTVSLFVGYADGGACGGSRKLSCFTDSARRLISEICALYKEKVENERPIRKLNISFGHLSAVDFINLDMFSDYRADDKERKKQAAVAALRERFGKNTVVRGMNLMEKATGLARNRLVGGHNGE